MLLSLSVMKQQLRIQYLIRQNGEQYVDNLISSETENTILEYLSEFLTNDNQCLIDEMIRRNSESADGLLFLRNLIPLNCKEGLIKYVEYVNKHYCVPEHEYSSVDITMQIRKIEDLSLLDQIIKLLTIAYDPNFLDKTERGLKVALDSVLYKMCKKSPNEMLSRLKSIELNSANDQLKTKYNYYISIINDELKIASDIPWTFDQAITYIKCKRKM